MFGVPDAVQRFFSGAPQSRDPFPLVVENMLAAGVAQFGQVRWGSLDPIGNAQEKHILRSRLTLLGMLALY
jgi:hypothetical protein